MFRIRHDNHPRMGRQQTAEVHSPNSTFQRREKPHYVDIHLGNIVFLQCSQRFGMDSTQGQERDIPYKALQLLKHLCIGMQ